MLSGRIDAIPEVELDRKERQESNRRYEAQHGNADRLPLKRGERSLISQSDERRDQQCEGGDGIESIDQRATQRLPVPFDLSPPETRNQI